MQTEYINELSKLNIVLTSSVDWVSLGGILLTALVVIGTTIFTIYHLKKTLNLQEKLTENRNQIEKEKSREEIISKNRQAWINSLRESISKYIAALTRVEDHTRTSDAKSKVFKSLKVESQVNSLINFYDSMDCYLSDAWSLKTGIKLHLNPDEKASKNLFNLLDLAYNLASNDEQKSNNEFWIVVGKIEQVSQIILKSEWERVKKFE